MKKIFSFIVFMILMAVISLFSNFVLAQSQQVIINQGQGSQSSLEPKLETGSVTPSYGPPGEFTFHTYFSDPQNRTPEYVKIYISDINNKNLPIEKTEPHLMQKSPTSSPQGIEYAYTANLTQEGQYQFYFEAKVGSTILHNPYYGGQNCQPGLCPECCGAWGGPKVLSEKLITNNKIYLFDKNNNQPIWSYDVGKKWITSVAISTNDKQLTAADNKGGLYLFNLDSNIPIWTYGVKPDTNTNENIEIGSSSDKGLVAFADNGYLVTALEKEVFLFKTASNQPIWQYDVGMGLEGLNISDDGKYISAGGHNTKVYLWETSNSQPKWEYKVESEGGILGLEGSVIRSMAMTPDGKYFTAGTSCPDRSIYVFQPDKSRPILKIKAGANFPVETIDISNDGQYVISAGGGSTDDPYSALLVRTNQEEPVWKFDYSKNPAISARISPDSQSIALGYILDGVYFLSRDSNQPPWQLKNAGYIGDMAFSADGNTLAVGTGTYHVLLLPSDGSKILQDWKVENKVESVAISADGQYIVAGTGLYRFLSIGSEGGNISGAGTGELEDSKPELVKLSTNAQKSQVQESATKISNIYFWIGLFLGIILIISGLIFIKKRKLWLVISLVIIGTGLIIVSSYYLIKNKKQTSVDKTQQEINNEGQTDQNIKTDNSYETNSSGENKKVEVK